VGILSPLLNVQKNPKYGGWQKDKKTKPSVGLHRNELDSASFVATSRPSHGTSRETDPHPEWQ